MTSTERECRRAIAYAYNDQRTGADWLRERELSLWLFTWAGVYRL